MYRIMLVDDEQGILRALRRELVSQKYEVDTYESAKEALQQVRSKEYDLIISDYRMPEMDGVSMLVEIKKILPDAARIILSGYSDLEALMGAINKAEIYRFISKPWHDYELKAAVAKALEHRAMLLENRRLADQVRAQQVELDKQRSLLERLEQESPGITHVDWAEDGSIIINEGDL